MITHRKYSNQTKRKKSGFTLIEVIAVLVLLGILAAIALPKYIDMANNARASAIEAGIAELNGREALAWGQQMLVNDGVPVDSAIQTAVGTSLGIEYTLAITSATAGTIQFQSYPTIPQVLVRTPAINTAPGSWK